MMRWPGARRAAYARLDAARHAESRETKTGQFF
jgi:hypothetical protein